MLEAIASPPYEKVNDVIKTLVFNPITQNNSIFRSQNVTKDLGDGILPCGLQSRAGRHGSLVGCPEGALEDMPNNLKLKCKLGIKQLTMVVDHSEVNTMVMTSHFFSEACLSLTP